MVGADKYTVLLVDDDEAIRAYLALILREEGFDVIGEASSIDAAEQQLRVRPASLVFLDINLPGENGLHALSKLSACFVHTRFVMISGEATPDMRQAAMNEGALGFVAKPFTIEKVSHEVARVLQLLAP